ncbi:Atlastin-1 [Hondaea fermentalgiana]|uniref:Atlastin-1 n=1 Tax=Hondaea fermentalgiana TaxID=2315210 RepID=A0A2R5GL28_9STRA|nr:Atlastin-1 [Hondaea fermentalgiana]|eukprot:GBG31009.1 Atlastin-1 [Hondaea fermentalgiana]
MGRYEGRAVKIIDIDARGESFVLNDKALKSVLQPIPGDMKLNIVSVVGAFRTGKSFILDLFLRYLRSTSSKPDKCRGEPDESWMYSGGKLEGNNNKADDSGDKAGGFGWRSGRERCTTGIWMWSEHFIRELPGGKGEKVAVLIMDTQGMFDSTLGQHLTASIFGLSTLISSYSVYNLDKRVQEDNLQHLALFSEYGRVALMEERKQASDEEWYSTADGEAESTGEGPRPFQWLELLVRDWQDFHDVEGPLEDIRADMKEYLGEILSERNQKDLKEVREQIRLCYEKVSVWMLPHPGFAVVKKNYNGDIDKISPDFRRLVADYIRRVFSKRMVVKKVSGRPVNATELYTYIKVYCSLFKEAKIFPEAKTLLAATTQANNMNAVQSALNTYKREMDKLVGVSKPYVSKDKLSKHHRICANGARDKFAEIATIGPVASIKAYREQLNTKIDERYREYSEANSLRDPLALLGPYLIPLCIAIAAYLIRYVVDTLCPRRSLRCMDVSDFFGALFFTIMSFLFFHIAAHVNGFRQRLKVMLGQTSEFVD